MVKAGFQGGFDLAQAGSDLFSKITPTGSGDTWQAQKDLISYMFAEGNIIGEPFGDYGASLGNSQAENVSRLVEH